MTRSQALRHFYQLLQPLSSAYREAEIIMQHKLGISREDLHAYSERPIASIDFENVELLIRERQLGKPLAYLLGFKDFYGARFSVGPGVLIPRPETELVVKRALQLLSDRPFLLADFGAGSGAIGLSILRYRPRAQLVAIEAEKSAADFLLLNVSQFGLASRVRIEQDRVENFRSEVLFDGIVANPPYIATNDTEVADDVRKYEPPAALFGGSTGLEMLFDWSKTALNFLRPGGVFVTEIGDRQGPAMLQFCKTLSRVSQVSLLKDEADRDRVISWEVVRG